MGIRLLLRRSIRRRRRPTIIEAPAVQIPVEQEEQGIRIPEGVRPTHTVRMGTGDPRTRLLAGQPVARIPAMDPISTARTVTAGRLETPRLQAAQLAALTADRTRQLAGTTKRPEAFPGTEEPRIRWEALETATEEPSTQAGPVEPTASAAIMEPPTQPPLAETATEDPTIRSAITETGDCRAPIAMEEITTPSPTGAGTIPMQALAMEATTPLRAEDSGRPLEGTRLLVITAPAWSTTRPAGRRA